MQARLFTEGTTPDCSTPEWYARRERAPHLEQGGHQGRLRLAHEYVAQAINTDGGTEVVDLGAGDGGLLSLIQDSHPYIRCWGYDLQLTNVAGALERGAIVELGDVLRDEIRWAPIVVATEMLEHLVDPHALVRIIGEHATWLIASSPAFETPESHYAHHLWAFDQDGYRDLVEQAGFTVVRHEVTGDFQVLLARR